MSRKQKVLIGHLNQEDCIVYATKAYGVDESTVYRGTKRTVKITIIDKTYQFEADYNPIAELETYVMSAAGNNKHWRKILKTLDDDCVVELISANGQIGIVQRDQTNAKTKRKGPLVDADTKFQIKQVFPTDNFGNNVILEEISAIKKYVDSQY